MRPDQKTSQTSSAKHDFLSSVGHELRNPLTTIIAQVEILLEEVYGPLEKAQKATLTSVQDNTRQMIQLITDVIDFCKIEAAPLPLMPAVCSLAEACDQSTLQVQDLARTRGIKLSKDIPSGNLSVMVDPKRLRQMLSELLSAALLTSTSGQRVQLLVSHDENGLQLRACHDPAPGTFQSHVIVGKDAVTQTSMLDRLEKIKPIGTALLQQLVRLHGGTFTIEANSDQIVSLSIQLPLEILPSPANAEPKQFETPPQQGAVSSAREKLTILVADDQHALVTVVSTYFESIGLEVITAQDGREAVELASKHHPDLIMMDVRMPVMDGLKALQEIRSSTDAKLRDVVIVSLSGIVGATDKDECMEAGATAYLNKPFGIRELDGIVKDYLGAAKPRSEDAS